MIYDSGFALIGTIKKLTFDENGHLLVITFSEATVKKSNGEILYRKEWGDFDLAVADYVEGVSLLP